MRGRGRMARQGLGVADIDQTLDHLERVIEFHASVEATLDAEGQQRRWPALEVLLRQRVVAVAFKSGVADPFNLFMCRQITRYGDGVVAVAIHAQRQRLHRSEERRGGKEWVRTCRSWGFA